MDYLKEILNEMEPNSEFTIIDHIVFIKNDINLVSFELEFNESSILPIKNNIMSNHIFRILKSRGLNKIMSNNIYDLFDFIDNCKPYSYCTICGCNIHQIKIISYCNSENCKKEFMKHVTNNILTKQFMDDKMVFNLIVLMTYSCIKHPQRNDIFKPFPICYKSFVDLENNVHFGYKNIKELFAIVERSVTDYELFNIIGVNDYSLLKFSFLTNTLNMQSDLLFTDDKNMFKNTTNILENNEILLFRVDHDPISDSKFNMNDPQYLFHGSTLSNWYSIIMNGLKVYSGTKMQLHGAAYGTGVYLSNTLATSGAYGIDKYCSSGLCMYGVFQVAKNKESYKKAPTIYVIDKEEELILRYLIVAKSIHGNLNTVGINRSSINNPNLINQGNKMAEIDKYFITTRSHEIKTSQGNYNMIRVKRISHDVSKIERLCKDRGYNLICNYGNMIDDNNNNNTTKLFLEKNNTKFGILYKDDYPVSPPFIWIIKTNKKIKNDDILKNGALFNKKLSYKTWQPTVEVYKVVKNLLDSVSEENQQDITFNEITAFEEYVEMSKKTTFS